MPQSNGIVSNGNGAQVRAAINENLSALFTSHSGTGKPNPSYAGQTWLNQGISPNRFELKKPGADFVPLRDVDGRVVLPALGYTPTNSNRKTATPSIYFEGASDTGFFKFDDDIFGFATKNTVHYVLGRSLGKQEDDGSNTLNQTNAFVIGPAAYQALPINPTTSNAPSVSAGFCVADTGQCHIGTQERPLTLNKMGNLSADAGLINFNVASEFVGQIFWDADPGEIIIKQKDNCDYRVKENVTPLKSAKASINKLKPIRYRKIGTKVFQHGFIAHEVQEALPEYYVRGEKDGVDSEGNPEYQSIRYERFAPLLTAALQEAFAEIASLTKRVKELEAKN